ncbi:hypothetical protein FJY63_14860, partial [Candidatus Sumerlaeota bacterium]|nr:hypothetical protein [Candidatus Sumerlaeota bacterium]
KALALFARALNGLAQGGCKWIAPDAVDEMFRLLEGCRSPGYDQWCWGYNADWQARAFFLPRFQPNAVVTVFSAQAFLDRYEARHGERDLEIARGACDFLVGRLNRSHESHSEICFSYTPFDSTRVHNVNLMIAALLARVSAITGETALADLARRAVAFSLARQAPDGSWPYGEARYQRWIDHFHTCYNLLALDDCRRYLRTGDYDNATGRGLTFYLENLFRSDGLPRPDTRRRYPIDSHSIATTLITLTRFESERPLCRHRREKIIEWTLRRMQHRSGFFYYQKCALWMARIPYIRWSQAWMFYALSLLVDPEKE